MSDKRMKTVLYLGLTTMDGIKLSPSTILQWITTVMRGSNGYTTSMAMGNWNNQDEQTIIVTQIGEGTAKSLELRSLGGKYKHQFQQETVLLEESLVDVEFL